jgi:hypothetical protein
MLSSNPTQIHQPSLESAHPLRKLHSQERNTQRDHQNADDDHTDEHHRVPICHILVRLRQLLVDALRLELKVAFAVDLHLDDLAAGVIGIVGEGVAYHRGHVNEAWVLPLAPLLDLHKRWRVESDLRYRSK